MEIHSDPHISTPRNDLPPPKETHDSLHAVANLISHAWNKSRNAGHHP